MKNSAIITPTNKIAVSHQHNLGVSNYDLEELWSPDTAIWRSKVLDLGSPKYPPQVATAPTRYWFDRSRYQNHGAITGAVWNQLPSGVWVLNFDGVDDKIVIPYTTALQPASITLLAWVKVLSGAADVAGGLIQRAFTSHVDPYYSYLMTITLQTTTPKLFAAFPVGGYSADDTITSTSSLTLINTWALLGASFDGTTMQLWENGRAIDSKVNAGALAYAGSVGVQIGSYTNTPTSDLKALIGKVWAFSSTLTAGEHRQIYLATKWMYQ